MSECGGNGGTWRAWKPVQVGTASAWWAKFSKDSSGTNLWHETFHVRGGMEAIYGDMPEPTGFAHFLPMLPAGGTMTSRHKCTPSREPGVPSGLRAEG